MADPGDRLPVVLMATLPVLATRVGWGLLRYEAQRRRGVRAFRRALLERGLPADLAERLAQAYHEIGSIRRVILAGTSAFR